MLNKLFNLFGKSNTNRNARVESTRASQGALPASMVDMLRKMAYQNAYGTLPEQLFRDPEGTLIAISCDTSTQFGKWTKRTLKNGNAIYLTKFPDFPIQHGKAQAGVGAVIVDSNKIANIKYFVLNVGSAFGPSVRKVFLSDGGGIASAQDGPGCENNIQAFFELMDSGKSGSEREAEECQQRISAAMALYDKEHCK